MTVGCRRSYLAASAVVETHQASTVASSQRRCEAANIASFFAYGAASGACAAASRRSSSMK
jgi:hypothetical protein